MRREAPALIKLAMSRLRANVTAVSSDVLAKGIKFVQGVVPVTASVPFPTRLVCRSVYHNGSVPKITTYCGVMYPFDHFVRRFFSNRTQEKGRPRVPRHFLISTRVNDRLFRRPRRGGLWARGRGGNDGVEVTVRTRHVFHGSGRNVSFIVLRALGRLRGQGSNGRCCMFITPKRS